MVSILLFLAGEFGALAVALAWFEGGAISVVLIMGGYAVVFWLANMTGGEKPSVSKSWLAEYHNGRIW